MTLEGYISAFNYDVKLKWPIHSPFQSGNLQMISLRYSKITKWREAESYFFDWRSVNNDFVFKVMEIKLF